jgi:hypothetical protein
MFMVDGDGFGWCQDFEPDNNVFGEGHGFGRGYGFYKGNGSGDGCGYGYGFGFRGGGACGYETSFGQLNAQNKSMFLDFNEH